MNGINHLIFDSPQSTKWALFVATVLFVPGCALHATAGFATSTESPKEHGGLALQVDGSYYFGFIGASVRSRIGPSASMVGIGPTVAIQPLGLWDRRVSTPLMPIIRGGVHLFQYERVDSKDYFGLGSPFIELGTGIALSNNGLWRLLILAQAELMVRVNGPVEGFAGGSTGVRYGF